MSKVKLAKKKTEASIRGDELEEGDAERHIPFVLHSIVTQSST